MTSNNKRKKIIDKNLLNHLINELTYGSGNDFQKFVTSLLEKRYGSTIWPPRNGCDGKIDFASNKILFQIYGAESPRGNYNYMKRKISEVPDMMKTARENGLTASNIIFLTNIHPDRKMGNLILESSKNGIKIKDVYKTAEFLYELYYPFEIIEQYQKYKYDDLLKEEWPYDIDQNTFVDNFNFNYGEVLNRNNDSKGEKSLSFISNRIAKNQIICVGYYGMGKTTISKMLFNNWNYDFSGIYPVYITLTHRSLKDFRSENLGKEVAKEIITTLSQINSVSERYNSCEIIEKELLDKHIYRMIENRKILLIFDGIDESKCERDELSNNC